MGISYEEAKLVTDKTGELSELYPIEATYSSKCSLWTEALRNDIVDEELFRLARSYYGRLWNYVGD